MIHDSRKKRTILGGFIGGLILWAIIYGFVNYVTLPQEYHSVLLKLLGIPAEVIVILAKILREKAGIAIAEPNWFFIQPVSWGIVGALVSLVVKVIKF